MLKRSPKGTPVVQVRPSTGGAGHWINVVVNDPAVDIVSHHVQLLESVNTIPDPFPQV